MPDKTLETTLYPFLLSAFFVLVAIFWSRRRNADSAAWLGSLALGLPFVVAEVLLNGPLTSFPPSDRARYLPLIAAAATALSLLASLRVAQSKFRLPLFLVAAFGTVWFSSNGGALPLLDQLPAAFRIGVLTLAAFFHVALFDSLSRSQPPRRVSLTMGLAVAGLAPLMLAAYSARNAQLTGSLGCAIAPLFLFSVLHPHPNLVRSAAAAFSLILSALTLYGATALSPAFPLWYFALPWVAPLLGWIARILPVRKVPPLAVDLLIALLVGIASCTFTALAVRGYVAASSGY